VLLPPNVQLREQECGFGGQNCANSLLFSLLAGNFGGEELARDCALRQSFWIDWFRPHQFHGQFHRRAPGRRSRRIPPVLLTEEMVTHRNYRFLHERCKEIVTRAGLNKGNGTCTASGTLPPPAGCGRGSMSARCRNGSATSRLPRLRAERARTVPRRADTLRAKAPVSNPDTSTATRNRVLQSILSPRQHLPQDDPDRFRPVFVSRTLQRVRPLEGVRPETRHSPGLSASTCSMTARTSA
jgi:hypothetical protein